MRSLAVAFFLVACSSSHGGGPEDAPASGDGSMLPDAGGGPISELRFAVVGDTRPANIDDTTAYPTAIITKIWQDIEAESPHPTFAISTGDYMFASPNGSEQQVQLGKYMTARAAYTGLQYPAMGNHECTGATDSNCGTGARDGITKNMTDFVTTMLHPIGQTQPYYTEKFTAQDGSWTAKFVFVACNAWNTTQASWLTTALSDPTTYTFVVRHEGDSALSQTPCSASSSIIAAHPLTLKIVGHTHTYAHYASSKEVVVGNGGAPLTSGMNYGYVIVSRNANGTLLVVAKDYMTGATLDTFTITAAGAGA
ncbi:MAG: metallophosphoesterase [Deltaproteobacteria bacterium]|nr:metallophosphoesterase [Deltaproteobacteria bacterium]